MLRQIPILSIVTWLPLAGAVAVAALPSRFAASIGRIAIAWAWLSFAASLALLGYDRAAGGFQFVEDAAWIAPLGARYTIGVDGISLVLVLLTTLVVAIAALASTSSIRERRREFYVLLLAAETALVGVFVSLDLFLFYVVWEAALVPVFFLVGIWGGERRRYAAVKLFVYTLAGSLVMLLAILELSAVTKAPATRASMPAIERRAAEITAEDSEARELVVRALDDVREGRGSFDLLALHAIGGARDATGAPVVPFSLQLVLFAGLFAGFALVVPLFPFHTWLPDAHVEAPTAGSVLLAGVLLNLGGYGLVRLSLPILPDASRDPRVSGVVAALAIAGIVYGALAAIYYAATAGDTKKLVAYSSISQMGMVVLGLFALDPSGIAGAVLQMVSHGIATSGLFLVVGALYERVNTREAAAFGGLARRAPRLATLAMPLVLSTIGVPPLAGFAAEFLLLRGVLEASPARAAGGAVGLVLGAVAFVWFYQRVFFGPEGEAASGVRDLDSRELAVLAPLAALVLVVGLYPRAVLDYVVRPAHLVAYEVWSDPEAPPRYAPTPEAQDALVRERRHAPTPRERPEALRP